jgi:UDP-glucose 4-epimerase
VTLRVLVTGALGCLGSATVRRLLEGGVAVRGLDNALAGHGANPRNLADVRARVELVEGDVRDAALVRKLVAGVDAVVHAAAHVSHTAGLEDPGIDLEHNVRGTLTLLDATRRVAPGARFVLLSTRGVYGAPRALPVSEDHPCAPLGMHEWSKLAAEEAVRTFGRLHGVRGVALRIANVYGPGSQLRSAEFGVVGWWIGRVLAGGEITVFGDGSVRRDLVYVEDAARAVAAAALAEGALPDTLNVGDREARPLREIAEAICAAAGMGRVVLAPYTAARKAMEVGDFATDITRIERTLGWHPTTPLGDGLRRTVDYYREHLGDYL